MWKLKLKIVPFTNRPGNYRRYEQSALMTALEKIRSEGMSAYKASKLYGVPQSTLKDRIGGTISDETFRSGPQPLLCMEEEARLVDHLNYMALLGYGYSRTEVLEIATQYAVECGKRSKDNPFSMQWFCSFRDRWPRLDLKKPESLSFARAKASSQDNIDKYFSELESVLTKYCLKDKPHCIYNIDEKGVNYEHTPPLVVAYSDSQPPAITAERSSNLTVIGCGNAMGTQIPPFLVFQGVRMRDELLDRCTPGTNGDVSLSGWSNGEIFSNYLKEHFVNYVQGLSADQPVLVLFDGHKSHVSLDLIDWARHKNIILFVLPAHTSHILQPLDVGCFGPYSTIISRNIHRYTRVTKQQVSRYNIGEIASKSYTQALSAENLKSAFRKTGIYPFDAKVISPDKLLPSTVLKTTEGSQDDDVVVVPSTVTDADNAADVDVANIDVDDANTDVDVANTDVDLVNDIVNTHVDVDNGVTAADVPMNTLTDIIDTSVIDIPNTVCNLDNVVEVVSSRSSNNYTECYENSPIVSFIENLESKVRKACKKTKKRNVLSRVVSGKAITEPCVMKQVQNHIENQNKSRKSAKVSKQRSTSNDLLEKKM